MVGIRTTLRGRRKLISIMPYNQDIVLSDDFRTVLSRSTIR